VFAGTLMTKLKIRHPAQADVWLWQVSQCTTVLFAVMYLAKLSVECEYGSMAGKCSKFRNFEVLL
jgi:hypothetical protein